MQNAKIPVAAWQTGYSATALDDRLRPPQGTETALGKSSGFGGVGSPRGGKTRTFLSLTIYTSALHNARRAARLAYHFEGAEPRDVGGAPAAVPQSVKGYRNPIVLAQEWRGKLVSGECGTQAELARQLGVTRARVTQVIGLLALAPEVLHAVAALGDPLAKPILTERRLRPILKLPAGEQSLALRGLPMSAATG